MIEMPQIRIKNEKSLLKNLPRDIKKRRRILLNITKSTLNELTPAKLFKNALKKSDIDGAGKLIVISIGKAGCEMADTVLAALKKLGRQPDKILIANKGHPLPTKQGVAATQKIIKEAAGLGAKDCAIVLISGGGSAMLTMPVPEITLQDKIKTTAALLKCGATIQEMNIIRKHLSCVKGGRLAKILYPARVLGFVISDVVGNDLETISSGPLSADKSTFKDALKIIKKYKLKMPQRITAYLKKGAKNRALETPKPGSEYFKHIRIRILADHSFVLKKAVKAAKKCGLHTILLGSRVTGEARDTAKKFIDKATKLQKKSIFLATGETTVTCRGCGYGGRNQELVLAGLRYLKANQTLVSIGTDGIDGMCPEKICGAVGDAVILEKAQKQKLNIENFLKDNDSYGFFKKTNGFIKTGATGTNVGDLIMLITE